MKRAKRFFPEEADKVTLKIWDQNAINPEEDTFPDRLASRDASVKKVQLGSNIISYNGSQLIITHLADDEIMCETDKDIRLLYKDAKSMRNILCIGDSVAYYQL